MGLCLSRYAGESILIGEEIEIEVGRVGREGKVMLVIKAPPELKVLRGELAGPGRRAEPLFEPAAPAVLDHAVAARLVVEFKVGLTTPGARPSPASAAADYLFRRGDFDACAAVILLDWLRDRDGAAFAGALRDLANHPLCRDSLSMDVSAAVTV